VTKIRFTLRYNNHVTSHIQMPQISFESLIIQTG